jgi:hypothetical protein
MSLPEAQYKLSFDRQKNRYTGGHICPPAVASIYLRKLNIFPIPKILTVKLVLASIT